jgi:hypothetical protein
MNSSPDIRSDSQIYYFAIGEGVWRGSFDFAITSLEGFKKARLSFQNRLLLRGMSRMTPARIDSKIWADRSYGAAGLAGNTVRISRFGITLYLLRETYTLDADGSDVGVHAHERFGPIPFVLRNEKRHPAVIHAQGMSSTYYIPLLGAEWIANYTVQSDRRHIDGHLTCPFAEAREVIHKLSG